METGDILAKTENEKKKKLKKNDIALNALSMHDLRCT